MYFTLTSSTNYVNLLILYFVLNSEYIYLYFKLYLETPSLTRFSHSLILNIEFLWQ